MITVGIAGVSAAVLGTRGTTTSLLADDEDEDDQHNHHTI
jgi:hypothetical protein